MSGTTSRQPRKFVSVDQEIDLKLGLISVGLKWHPQRLLLTHIYAVIVVWKTVYFQGRFSVNCFSHHNSNINVSRKSMVYRPLYKGDAMYRAQLFQRGGTKSCYFFANLLWLWDVDSKMQKKKIEKNFKNIFFPFLESRSHDPWKLAK